MYKRWRPSSRRDRRHGSQSGRRASEGADKYLLAVIGGFTLVVILMLVALVVFGS